MSRKDTKRNMWNIIIVILAVVVITAAYILISNPGDEINILSIADVMDNYNEYLGKTVSS